MNTIKAIIIDDEPLARQIVREFLGDFPQIEVVAECKNGVEAVKAIDRYHPDVVFLDVKMPGLSGFDVLKQIKFVPSIIFSTAYDEYAIKAFEVNAIDYLLKPYDRQRFSQAVKRILERPAGTHIDIERLTQLLDQIKNQATYSETLMVRKGDHLIPVKVSDIEWIEAADDYSILHIGSDKYISGKGLGDLKLRLNPQMFLHIHRSTILNITMVRSVEPDGRGGMIATLKSGAIVKVSRSRVAQLRKIIV